MNRCVHLRKGFLLSVCLALALVLLAWPGGPAQAQVKRAFPHKSEPARLEFTASAREIVVNGRPERTGPGMRVYDAHNRLVFANRLQGQQFEVQLRRGPGGVVQDIWILNPAEQADPRRARTAAGTLQGSNLRYDAQPPHHLN